MLFVYDIFISITFDNFVCIWKKSSIIFKLQAAICKFYPVGSQYCKSVQTFGKTEIIVYLISIIWTGDLTVTEHVFWPLNNQDNISLTHTAFDTKH